MTGPHKNSNSDSNRVWSELSAPVLIMGGAYSGKSEFAHRLLKPDVAATVLGTCGTDHPELDMRVKHLQSLRPGPWHSLEGLGVAPNQLESLRGDRPQFLFDAVNHWLAERLLTLLDRYSIEQLSQVISDHCEAFASWFGEPKEYRCVVVTADLSHSLPPETAAPRILRRALGMLNQNLADKAATVIEVKAGLGRILKSE